VRRIFGNFSFRFAIKGVRKTVRYNDTIDANKRVTYCIIHELLLIKALRLMSAFDDNLFIFFCGVSPHASDPPPSPLDCTCSRVGTARQKDKILFRHFIPVSSSGYLSTCVGSPIASGADHIPARVRVAG
jgi:hypothetical protein